MRRFQNSTYSRFIVGAIILAFLLLTLAIVAAPGVISARSDYTWVDLQAMILADQEPPQDLRPAAAVPCVGGFAGVYPCSNVDLMAFLPLSTIGGGSGNDVWGWTGCGSREFALMGRTSGTAFVEITNPESPIYLGNLPTQTSASTWRDIKTYLNYAYVVSEASGHGMQVFDLNQLCTVTNPPVTFSVTAHYSNFSNAHNLVINTDSGYAYAVGTNTCSGGLHMISLANPTAPAYAGCYSGDGYTHDAQCVNYIGPDVTYQGHEICFNSNEDTITIVDVTNKAAPALVSRTGYSGSAYTHQGWLTASQRIFVMDDELDEVNFGHNTKTRFWNVRDLNNPSIRLTYDSPIPAIDHNQYVAGRYVYQANYRGGLRILGLRFNRIQQVAYFDIYPASDSASFNGAWSVYPYFDSGIVLVSGIEQGLFVLRPNLTLESGIDWDVLGR